MNQPALDLLCRQRRFLHASVLRRNPGPRWTTDHRVTVDHPAYRLREFGSLPAPVADVTSPGPVLIVPPEVNRSYIVDFAPGQSLVQTVLDAGFPRVGVIDWRSVAPGRSGWREVARRDVDDSLATILDAIDVLGGPVHLVGLCQGGWESAMIAALHPERVASLTLVAAPIDFHAGDAALKQVAGAIPMGVYAAMVASGGGVMRGELISSGFDNLLPLERYGLKWLRVWSSLEDDEVMERFHRLEDWYRCPKDLPGPMYLRAVRELFKGNKLVRGRFVALGRRVDLSAIQCPLALVTGTRDHITPPPQTLAMRGHASSPRVLEASIAAGHVGTFMGKAALRDHWPGILEWLKTE